MSYQKWKEDYGTKEERKESQESNIITLKLTDIELAVLNEATGITGLSRSEYLRKLLLAPFAHSFASTSELLPPRKLVDMINTFFCHNQISPFSAVFFNLTYNFRRHSCRNHIGRNIFCYNCSGCNIIPALFSGSSI